MNDKPPSEALAAELGDNATSDVGWSIIRYVNRWETDKNPHWIDLAIVVVTNAGLLIPPCLQVLAAHIAQRRIQSLEQAAGGPSVIKEEILQMAMAQIAYLIAWGKVHGKITVKQASVHAANAVAAIYGPLYKASYLEMKYGEGRITTYSEWEKIFSAEIAENPSLGIRLLDELNKIPNIDPGNRRE